MIQIPPPDRVRARSSTVRAERSRRFGWEFESLPLYHAVIALRPNSTSPEIATRVQMLDVAEPRNLGPGEPG